MDRQAGMQAGRGSLKPSMGWRREAADGLDGSSRDHMDRQAGRQAGRGSVEYWMAGEALSLQWSGWKQQRPYRQAGR